MIFRRKERLMEVDCVNTPGVMLGHMTCKLSKFILNGGTVRLYVEL